MRYALNKMLIMTNIFLCSSYLCSSQNNLFLKNTQTGKLIRFYSKETFHYRLQIDIKERKGLLKEVRDSVIILKNQELSLSGISFVRKLTPVHEGFRIAAAPIIFLGISFLVSGPIYYYTYGINTQDALKLSISGFGIFIIGLAPYIFKKKGYDIGREWKLIIK